MMNRNWGGDSADDTDGPVSDDYGHDSDAS